MNREKDFFDVLRSIKGKFRIGVSGVYFLEEKITPEEFEKCFEKIATKITTKQDHPDDENYEMITNDQETYFTYFPKEKTIEFT